jgi:hypothetical protein
VQLVASDKALLIAAGPRESDLRAYLGLAMTSCANLLGPQQWQACLAAVGPELLQSLVRAVTNTCHSLAAAASGERAKLRRSICLTTTLSLLCPLQASEYKVRQQRLAAAIPSRGEPRTQQGENNRRALALSKRWRGHGRCATSVHETVQRLAQQKPFERAREPDRHSTRIVGLRACRSLQACFASTLGAYACALSCRAWVTGANTTPLTSCAGVSSVCARWGS